MTYFKVAYLKSHSALPKFLKLIEKEKVKPSMEVVGDGKQINGIWQFIFSSKLISIEKWKLMV